jgi:hypothetical protein
MAHGREEKHNFGTKGHPLLAFMAFAGRAAPRFIVRSSSFGDTHAAGLAVLGSF